MNLWAKFWTTPNFELVWLAFPALLMNTIKMKVLESYRGTAYRLSTPSKLCEFPAVVTSKALPQVSNIECHWAGPRRRLVVGTCFTLRVEWLLMISVVKLLCLLASAADRKTTRTSVLFNNKYYNQQALLDLKFRAVEPVLCPDRYPARKWL